MKSATTPRAWGVNLQQYGILLALFAIVVLFNVLTAGRLLAPNNVASLIQQNAYVMVLAIGMTMVIIARHIDLSVGSVVAFVGGVAALVMAKADWSWPAAIGLALLLGLLIGAWQGFWVAYIGVPAFIVTLGGMLIFRGLAIVLVEETTTVRSASFVRIANGSVPSLLGYVGDLDVLTLLVGGVALAGIVWAALTGRARAAKSGQVLEAKWAFAARTVIIGALVAYLTYRLSLSNGGTPIVLLIIAALVLLYTFVMNRTVFGRHIYAVGGNLAAARLSGVKTKRVDFLVFVNMGLLAAMAGIITTARAGAAVATAGNVYELDAIAAAFIGGTAVSGGKGKISGAIIGALIMGVLNMGLSIMSVDSAWQQSIKGLVVLVAVAADMLANRKER